MPKMEPQIEMSRHGDIPACAVEVKPGCWYVNVPPFVKKCSVCGLVGPLEPEDLSCQSAIFECENCGLYFCEVCLDFHQDECFNFVTSSEGDDSDFTVDYTTADDDVNNSQNT